MTRVRTLHALLAVAALAAGCATAPAPSGRYMQIKHPMTGIVVAQMTWPTPEGCAFVIRAMKIGEAQARQAADFASCKADSASQALPYKATLHDSTGDYRYDIETVGLIQCGTMVRAMLNTPGSTSEIVTDCKGS